MVDTLILVPLMIGARRSAACHRLNHMIDLQAYVSDGGRACHRRGFLHADGGSNAPSRWCLVRPSGSPPGSQFVGARPAPATCEAGWCGRE